MVASQEEEGKQCTHVADLIFFLFPFFFLSFLALLRCLLAFIGKHSLTFVKSPKKESRQEKEKKERQRERERETETHRETQRERDRDRDRDGERDRELSRQEQQQQQQQHKTATTSVMRKATSGKKKSREADGCLRALTPQATCQDEGKQKAV